MKRYKELYKKLMLNEELFDMFPELTGEWSVDKKEFVLLQQQMENLSEFINVEEDEDYDG